MEQIYTLKGLDCPHCSAEIERAVGQIEGVTRSAVNLMQQTLTVTSETLSTEMLTPQIRSIVRSHEPDVEVIAHDAQSQHIHSALQNTSENRSMIIRLIAGGVLFLIGMLFAHLTALPDTVSLCIFITAYLILGYDVIAAAVKNIARGKVFDEHFLMTVSTVSAFCIGEYPEAAAVMLLYQTGELLESLAVQKSRRTISSLLDIRPDTAYIEQNGEWTAVRAETVTVGARILVRAGERVPLDGIVCSGSSMLNTAALTGESAPQQISAGDAVLSGCINQNSPLTVEVTKSFQNSTASRIIDMVENAAARKAKAEHFITKFARIYTPAVVLCAVLLALIPPLFFHAAWAEWIHRACVFLIISCPCAVVISVPLTFFGGIGAASKRGILMKGSNYLEAMSKVSIIAFDKTGTLTEGKFRVTKIVPAPDVPKDLLLETAARAERFSDHPIAQSVRAAYSGEYGTESAADTEELTGLGIRAEIDGKTVYLGNAKLMQRQRIAYVPCDAAGTKLYAAIGGQYAGCILISDTLKPGAKETIAALRKSGIRHMVMLTGDNAETASYIAEKLGMDAVFADLLPADKVQQIETLEAALADGETLAFVGDGINDAPVLARADVGIAMGALGADAAIEAADVVLMTDEPRKLLDARDTACRTKQIVKQNLIFVLGVKLLMMLLGALGIAGMWAAVFGDVGITILAVLNAMRMLRVKNDAD